jgi:long-chain acyl-CoA synthetase
MKGYWNAPAETAAAIRVDGEGRRWLYTGDVARMDEDGYTYIVQRKKDLIIVDGFNVYPSEVESVLYAHPDVREAAVIGVPHAYHGEVVKACVVLKGDATTTLQDLREHCSRSLARYKQPCELDIRESLPKSAVGKVLYRVLREEALGARPDG